jgi:hypothetical protein
MSEAQVRARLYEPPEGVRRIESKLACMRIAAAPRMRGEDLRLAFESRLARRTDAPAEPAGAGQGPRIRLIA